MRLDSIATRIAVALVLTIVLSVALTVAVAISRGIFLRSQEQSNTQMFLGRSFVATVNRYHNPQLLAGRFAAMAAALTKAPASEPRSSRPSAPPRSKSKFATGMFSRQAVTRESDSFAT